MPIKHKEETPTQALTKDIQNNLSVIKDDIVASSQENVINGEELDDFIYHHFLNRLDPVEYCENVLRHHLPESRQKLHENQTALIRAVCNPKLKQVAGMMSRQCLLKGTIIHTRDGKLIPIEEYKDAWKTNDNAPIFEIHVKGGHIIKCTGNHPIKTQNGWKRADELAKQDWVLCLDYWDKFNDEYTLQYLTENIKDIVINNHYAKIKNILSTQIQYMREILNKLGVHGKINQNEIEIDLTYRNNLLNFKKIFPNITITDNFVQTDLDVPIEYGIDGEHLYYSPFVSRKEIGIGEVWDVEFPNKSWFIAGGMVVHNSGKTESISSFCGFLIDNYPQMRVGVFTPRLQQAEVSIGRLSTFFQMNEDRLNNKIVKLTKDRIELSNKSYVTAVSASDQSNIEGLTFDVIVLDEAQKVSDYTWSERIVNFPH